MTDDSIPSAYVSDAPRGATPTAEQLRSRVPGWGADLDPANRPSVPRLDRTLPDTGAHWDFPERQPGGEGRERSIEHAFLTPVFGTTAPLHGLSGAIRRLGYRYSEARTAHWLLLIAGDRVDAVSSRLVAALHAHPDDLTTETGVLAERGKRPIASRVGSTRADTRHSWLDPILVIAPSLLTVVGLYRLVRRLRP